MLAPFERRAHQPGEAQYRQLGLAPRCQHEDRAVVAVDARELGAHAAARARDDDDDLARVHDRAHADRQRHLGHGRLVEAEEAAVGLNRVVRERLDSCAA
jgi:hypothetical protein